MSSTYRDVTFYTPYPEPAGARVLLVDLEHHRQERQTELILRVSDRAGALIL